MNPVRIDPTYFQSLQHYPYLFNCMTWKTKVQCVWANKIKPPITQFSTSLLGKVTLCSLAELTGAFLGRTGGEIIVSHVSSKMGEKLIHHLSLVILAVSVMGNIYALSKKAKRSTIIIFNFAALASSFLLMSQSSKQLSSLGASVGYEIGSLNGQVFGEILGGFLGLTVTKSSIKFWDQHHPFQSYLMCSFLYISTGLIYNAMVCPRHPVIAFLTFLPSKILCFVLQQMAFNSATIVPFLEQCIHAHAINQKLLKPVLMQIAMRSIFKFKCDLFCHSKKTHKKLSDSIENLSLILLKTIKIKQTVDDHFIVNQTANYFIKFTLRSLHDYILMLTGSKSLCEAQNTFNQCFNKNVSQENKNTKNNLESAKNALCLVLDQEISQDTIYKEKIISILAKDKTKRIISLTIKKIQEQEIELIGWPLLCGAKADYCEQLINIYLKYYLIYTLNHYDKMNKDLTVSEEKELILSLNSCVVETYIKCIIPSFIAPLAQGTITYSLEQAFALKDMINSWIQKSEQRTHLDVEENRISVSDYFNKPPKAKSQPVLGLDELPHDRFKALSNESGYFNTIKIDKVKDGWTLLSTSV